MSQSDTHQEMNLVGRAEELIKLKVCLQCQRHVLLEGPVGVGKTRLAIEASKSLQQKVYRIDGDSRFTEQKLVGWFDPPLVMKFGFNEQSFIEGPLLLAMKSGGILFINELNRLPEGVQNVLLPALDEGLVEIPKLGTIQAQKGFCVIATQNPKEFVATTHLSEALLDRFELMVMDYQSEVDEKTILIQGLNKRNPHASSHPLYLKMIEWSVRLVRLTRQHPKIKRGASIRAAQALSELSATYYEILIAQSKISNPPLEMAETAFLEAAYLALPTRLEFHREAFDSETDQQEFLQQKKLIESLVQTVFTEEGSAQKK
jgi:MoxR-like ATPase